MVSLRIHHFSSLSGWNLDSTLSECVGMKLITVIRNLVVCVGFTTVLTLPLAIHHCQHSSFRQDMSHYECKYIHSGAGHYTDINLF